jgi:antitoxin MazE
LEVAPMKISKWGNSLAIRIPSEVVQKLGLRPDEEAVVNVTGENSFEVVRDRRRLEAIERLRAMRVTLPDGFVFDRDEIYDS